jgi:hypothetical protein
VDLKACEVRLEAGTTKNGETRELPFAGAPELVEMFQSLRAETTKLEQAEGRIIRFVFHRAGKRIKSFRGAWQAACKAAGCPVEFPTTSGEPLSGTSIKQGFLSRWPCKSPDIRPPASTAATELSRPRTSGTRWRT